MVSQTIEAIVGRWPGVTCDLKWEVDRVWSVAGKMFCVVCEEGPDAGRLSVKVADHRFLEYTDRPGFRPAPYLARAHWVTLASPNSIAADEVVALLQTSYSLVKARLPKKVQRALDATLAST